ncbi:acyl-CoA thioesterase [Salinigranum sp. GCM10025319]|uniref:acyl-CoA thioesterase n=1 Tax=Salinigranum sp. GCM10025319 TaxID=3252687 RepID=UPI00361D95BF
MSGPDLHYRTTVEVRYSDLDTFGHVNNAVYATFCEEARVDYFRDVLDQGVHDVSFVVVRLEIDIERSIRDVGEAAVAVGITEFGRTSFTLGYELRYEGEVVASGESVQVAVDDDGQPTAVPEEWRERVAAARSDAT